jgi:NFU1 iron-sulfur cluster scaffold homolog, mitochondrial
MPVQPEPTPNPNAIKFTVGRPVGGPKTFADATDAESEPVAAGLLGIDGVTSVFMTADFVTVTKQATGDWEIITPQATSIIETHLG